MNKTRISYSCGPWIAMIILTAIVLCCLLATMAPWGSASAQTPEKACIACLVAKPVETMADYMACVPPCLAIPAPPARPTAISPLPSPVIPTALPSPLSTPIPDNPGSLPCGIYLINEIGDACYAWILQSGTSIEASS